MAPAVRCHLFRAVGLGALFVVVAAHTRAVYAEGQRVDLTYMRDDGAESCPDELSLKKQIAGQLGYDPFNTGDPREAPTRQISCRLSKVPNKDEFIATLQTAEPHIDTIGRRELRSGPSCDALAASVVLSLSMAIDPIAAEKPRPQAPLPRRPSPSLCPCRKWWIPCACGSPAQRPLPRVGWTGRFRL